MKFFYKKYLRLVITIFLILLFVTLAKLFEFDFELDLLLFFLVFLFFTLIYLYLEAVQNRRQIRQLFKSWVEKEKKIANEKKNRINEKIIFLLPILNNRIGRFLAYKISSVILFFIEIFYLLKNTIFSKYVIFALCIFGIIFEIFIITSTVDWLILLFTCLWILVIILFKFKSKITIIGVLLFLVLTPILLVMKKDFLAEKTANWAYMFLLVGVIQLVWESRKEDFRH